MTGSAERTASQERKRLRGEAVCFVAVDGGSGAHLLAKLAHLQPVLRQVASPRHANLLLVVSPLSSKMRELLAEVAQSVAQPSRAVVIDSDHALGQAIDTHALLRHAAHVSSFAFESVLTSCFDTAAPAFAPRVVPEGKPETLDASSEPTDVETEKGTLSLGPVQQLTAGPLRMLLVCDGEQIVRAELRAGYACRGVADAMRVATWKEAAEIARGLDPLAPFAGRLAYALAVEALQHREPNAERAAMRASVLALERARNALWWLVRFADLLDVRALTQRAFAIASHLDGWASCVGDEEAWRGRAAGPRPDLASLARDVESLTAGVARDRLLGLRCNGVGLLGINDAWRHGISGPSLAASRNGNGDAHARIVTRLAAAGADLHAVANANLHVAPFTPIEEPVPPGSVDVTVEGPRGTIGLTLASGGREHPARVAWRRPSAAVLDVLPHLLKGQIVGDAEIIVASFDIAMAEADG